MKNDAHQRADELGPTDLPRLMSLAVHELRTPVTVVAGYLRMLLREQGGPLTDKQRKMLEEADRSCTRIALLVSELSELGKLESRELVLGRMELDMVALVRDVAAAIPENDHGVRLDTRCNSQIMVTGDRTRLAAAVDAVLRSTLRERVQPGVIVVECRIVESWGVVAIGDEALVPSLICAAGATPHGFDEWRGGMGLSLPVARRVLEAHGGALWSLPDGPSRTASALRLPLSPSALPPPPSS